MNPLMTCFVKVNNEPTVATHRADDAVALSHCAPIGESTTSGKCIVVRFLTCSGSTAASCRWIKAATDTILWLAGVYCGCKKGWQTRSNASEERVINFPVWVIGRGVTHPNDRTPRGNGISVHTNIVRPRNNARTGDSPKIHVSL